MLLSFVEMLSEILGGLDIEISAMLRDYLCQKKELNFI
jgi:hypothetical protein